MSIVHDAWEIVRVHYGTRSTGSGCCFASLQNARAPSGLGNYIKGSADGDVVHHGINLDVFPSIPPSLYMVYKVNPPLIMAKSIRGLVGPSFIHMTRYISISEHVNPLT